MPGTMNPFPISHITRPFLWLPHVVRQGDPELISDTKQIIQMQRVVASPE